jgi:hypothetical protein
MKKPISAGRTSLFGMAVTLLLFLGISASAEIKNFTFQGTIESVDDIAFVLDGSITNGATFEGFYVFDSAAADSSSDPTVGDYKFNRSAFGLVVKVGSYVFRTNPRHVDFVIEVVNRPGADSYLLRSYHNVCSQPLPIDHIAWQLDDSSGTALSDDLLPLAPPMLSAYQSLFGLTLEGGCDAFFVRGKVTSISEAPAVIPVRPAVEIVDAVEVRWPSRMGYFYQIQSSEDMVTWTNVGEPVLGDGTSLSRFFARQQGRSVFYRAEIANFSD